MLLKKGKRARIVYKGNVVSEEVKDCESYTIRKDGSFQTIYKKPITGCRIP